MQNRLAYLQSLFIRDTTLSYFFADAHHHQYACCGVMHAWPHGQWTRRWRVAPCCAVPNV